MDKCEQCIRNRFFSKEICSSCGEKEVVYTLEGACLVGIRQKCGVTFVGSSFLAPCETDDTKYRVRIVDNSIKNLQCIELGKILRIKPLLLKKVIENGQDIGKEYPLRDIMAIRTCLQMEGIKFEILPEPEYRDFYQCKSKHV